MNPDSDMLSSLETHWVTWPMNMEEKKERIKRIWARLSFSWCQNYMAITDRVIPTVCSMQSSVSVKASEPFLCDPMGWHLFMTICALVVCLWMKFFLKTLIVISKQIVDSLLFLILYFDRYFIIFDYVYVWGGVMYVWLEVSMESRREHWTPWMRSYRCLWAPKGDAETQVFCKSGKHY